MNVQAARAAFSGLAFKRFQHVPLYLEYAPKDAFAAKPAPAAAQPAGEAAAHPAASIMADSAAVDDAADSATLFIKNLSFDTTADTLHTFCAKAAQKTGGDLRTIRLVTGKRPDGKVVPRGFAFAEFSDGHTARALLKAMQGATLDGHSLELQLSAKKGISGSKRPKVQHPGRHLCQASAPL